MLGKLFEDGFAAMNGFRKLIHPFRNLPGGPVVKLSGPVEVIGVVLPLGHFAALHMLRPSPAISAGEDQKKPEKQRSHSSIKEPELGNFRPELFVIPEKIGKVLA